MFDAYYWWKLEVSIGECIMKSFGKIFHVSIVFGIGHSFVGIIFDKFQTKTCIVKYLMRYLVRYFMIYLLDISFSDNSYIHRQFVVSRFI